MTKSKGIGRGGHRKGAGRPRFTKTGKASYFSTRITQRTRDLLEAEAKLHEESLSAVAEHLLQIGLEERAERRKRKKGPLRALCFLLERLTEKIPGHHLHDPKYFWYSNPYMFEAFGTAVLHLLDALRPSGEIVTPAQMPPPRNEEELDQQDIFPDTPQEHGHVWARRLFVTMRIHALHAQDPTNYKLWGDFKIPSKFVPEYYGFIDALRDLGVKELSPSVFDEALKLKEKFESARLVTRC
jgi:hypothetical protein